MSEEYYAGLHIYLIKPNVKPNQIVFFLVKLCNNLSAKAGMMRHAG